MNDLKNLLERALDNGPAAEFEVDPMADLIRGRNRLRHRRTVTLTVASAAAAALSVGVVSISMNGTAAPAIQIQAGRPSSSATEEPAALPSLELVTYQGKQVPGYRVASTPKGWVIQGGDPAVLTIAPKGAKDKHYDSFVGKLVVMLQSEEAEPPTEGTKQPVDGRPGWLKVEGGTQMLTYQGADKAWIVIQAPISLGWDGDRLAQFATGVEVLGNARPGHG